MEKSAHKHTHAEPGHVYTCCAQAQRRQNWVGLCWFITEEQVKTWPAGGWMTHRPVCNSEVTRLQTNASTLRPRCWWMKNSRSWLDSARGNREGQFMTSMESLSRKCWHTPVTRGWTLSCPRTIPVPLALEGDTPQGYFPQHNSDPPPNQWCWRT